jgi:hypothetical protein
MESDSLATKIKVLGLNYRWQQNGLTVVGRLLRKSLIN